MLAHPQGRTLRARGLTLPRGDRPLIMGILNVTPDSFSDGGAYASADAAVAAALRMIEEGAAIIDVGGESTRPGHEPVDASTELARVIPVIEALAPKTDAPISIDTSKAEVAAAALRAGAHIVNDIWGFTHDPEIAAAAGDAGAAVVIMHNRERIESDIEIFTDMRIFFERAVEKATRAGISHDAIVLDPGIGFGKTLAQNLAVLNDLGALNEFGFPVLLGASRKSFIGKVSPSEPGERLGGSIATTVLAALAGTAIVRVHDVGAHKQALDVLGAIQGGKS